jgi:hypothetical protein
VSCGLGSRVGQGVKLKFVLTFGVGSNLATKLMYALG